jgi:two-component system, OmpR family, phosphate regulon sensor histidine kinase PhoR
MKRREGKFGDLRMPAVATVALAAVAVAALGGSTPYLVLATVAGALLLVWGVGLDARRQRRGEDERLERALAAAQAGADREREAREEALRVVELLDLLPMPILATGVGGQVVVCNPAATAMLGLPRERIVGRAVVEVFTQEEILLLLERASSGESVRAHVRISRAGGTRIWEVSALGRSGEIRGSKGGLVVIALRDMTEEARSLQVRTEFVANASHELRTPIAAMRVAMDTLAVLDAEGDAAARARFLEMVGRNLERLEAIIRDLLDLSRLESLDEGQDTAKREPVAASSLASELAPMYEQVLRERRLELVFDLAPELEHLQSDRELLLLILGNLIDNAAKFAFEGTQITVSGERVGEAARLVVADQGVGIPLDQQQRIFERFYQVDPARSVGQPRRGTGLGLSIVKHALRRLGGTIRVESVWQQGTRMIVEIPGFWG